MADALTPPTQPGEPWLIKAADELKKMREGPPLDASVNYAVKQNPATSARAQELAKEFKIPLDLAEKQTEELDAASRRKKIFKNLQGSPILKELMKDPKIAAVFHGDIPALVEMESSVPLGRHAEAVIDNFNVSAALAVEGVQLQWEHISEGVDKYLSYDENPRFEKGRPKSRSELSIMESKRIGDEIRAKARAGLDLGGPTEEAIFEGFVSLAQMAPALVGGTVAGGPIGLAGSLGYMWMMTQPEAYLKYLERGGTRGQALGGSFIEGGAEVLLESVPFSFFINKVGKVGLAKLFAGMIVREELTELPTTAIQEFADTMIANPDKTFADYKNELPMNLYQTFIATLVGTMGATGGGGIMGFAANRYGDNLDAAQTAVDNAEQLDKQVGTALKSETRKIAPESYKRYLDALFDESDTVHMEPDDARAFFEEHPETMDYFPAERQQEIRETLDEDFDVGITRSELLTYLPEFYEEVRELVRSDIDGMTLAEYETAPIDREGFADTAEITLEEMDRAIQAEESGQKIFESFKQQSIEAGVSRRDSNVGATLVKNFSMILSDKLDQDAGQPFNTPESVFSAAGNLQVQHGTITKNEDGTVNIEAAIKAGQLDGVMLDEVDVEMDNGDFKSIEMPAELAFDEAKKKTDALQKLQDCING